MGDALDAALCSYNMRLPPRKGKVVLKKVCLRARVPSSVPVLLRPVGWFSVRTTRTSATFLLRQTNLSLVGQLSA